MTDDGPAQSPTARISCLVVGGADEVAYTPGATRDQRGRAEMGVNLLVGDAGCTRLLARDQSGLASCRVE